MNFGGNKRPQRLTATFVLQQYKRMLIFYVLLSRVLMRCEGGEQIRLILINCFAFRCFHYSTRFASLCPNFACGSTS